MFISILKVHCWNSRFRLLHRFSAETERQLWRRQMLLTSRRIRDPARWSAVSSRLLIDSCCPTRKDSSCHWCSVRHARYHCRYHCCCQRTVPKRRVPASCRHCSVRHNDVKTGEWQDTQYLQRRPIRLVDIYGTRVSQQVNTSLSTHVWVNHSLPTNLSDYGSCSVGWVKKILACIQLFGTLLLSSIM